MQINYIILHYKGTKNTKFLGLDIDSSLSWKNYIDQMMIKLS